MSYPYFSVPRSLPRYLVISVIAGALVTGVEQTNVAARPFIDDRALQTMEAILVADEIAIAPITESLPYALKAGYSVVCNSVVRARTRGGRSWTISRTYRYATSRDGGQTVLTYDVLKDEVSGDVRDLIDDAGTGFRIVLNETQDIVGKELWLNPDFRWGKRQRAKRFAGLDREIMSVVGTKRRLDQGVTFWHENVAEEMASALLREFDSSAKLNRFSDARTVQGIGILAGEDVIVIDGRVRQSGFGRGISIAVNDQIRSLRYLKSGLPAGEETSRSINNGVETHEARTTCVQTHDS